MAGRSEEWRRRARQLAAVNRAALAIAGDLDLRAVLERILRTARQLVHARYGALGIPDGHGGFGTFLTVGISQTRAKRIGSLPRVHGVLGTLLNRPIRMADIRRHPDFSWYPAHHPELRDFLGVPIRHQAAVLGNLFLSGSRTGRFSAEDQRTVALLAAHAGIAISTARLYGEAQELATLKERNRLARELHDAVAQTLFSMMFVARSAAMAPDDPRAVKASLERLEHQAAAALREMQGLVFALRPKTLEQDGLAAALREHIDALRQTHPAPIELQVEGDGRLLPEHELALLRIGQEAVQNAVKHAGPVPIRVVLRFGPQGTELTVRDRGRGFSPALLPGTVRTMGLTSIRERAAAISAALKIDTQPGRGAVVTVLLPHRGR